MTYEITLTITELWKNQELQRDNITCNWLMYNYGVKPKMWDKLLNDEYQEWWMNNKYVEPVKVEIYAIDISVFITSVDICWFFKSVPLYIC